jgi:hypothetical protein
MAEILAAHTHHLRAKNDAAFEMLREVLAASGIADPTTAVEFLMHLSKKGISRGVEAVELNEIFKLVLFGSHLLMIPKEPFAASDILLLKNFLKRHAFTAERIEFGTKSYTRIPRAFLPGYLRACLTRGLGRS